MRPRAGANALSMIDENLCGPALTPSEKARFTARRKEAYEALHPETKRGANNQHTVASRQLGEAT